MSRKIKFLVVAISSVCVLSAAVVLHFIVARQGSAEEACLNNLRQIGEATKQWDERSETNFQSGGFLHIEFYIEQLLQSRKKSGTVLVTTKDGPHTLQLNRHDSQTVLSFLPDRPDGTWNNAEEANVRDFFNKRGMTPSREIRSADRAYDDKLRGFEFKLPNNSKTISRLCVSLFTDLYDVSDQKGLSITTMGL